MNMLNHTHRDLDPLPEYVRLWKDAADNLATRWEFSEEQRRTFIDAVLGNYRNQLYVEFLETVGAQCLAAETEGSATVTLPMTSLAATGG